MLKSLFGGSRLPSDINNPFSVERIVGISINYGITLLGGTPYFRGSVEFKNGNTSAKQDFKGENLVDVFIKIRNFCENLEVNNGKTNGSTRRNV